MASHGKVGTQQRADVHENVTNRIIEMLETAQAHGAEMPWCRPGVAHSRPTNVASKQRYRGINVLSLWSAADAANYRTGLWATFKQWKELGASVKKGEHAAPIVYYKPLEIANDKADLLKGDDPTKIVRMVKGYWAFNADQVEGYELPAMPTDNLVQRVEHAEAFFANTRIPIAHGGTRAFYRPSEDRIQMPDKVLFRDTRTSTATEGYMAVVAHELGHATGASHRLNRNLSGRFGYNQYTTE